MKIALIGYGKMGRIIETLALEKGDEIVARIDEGKTENLIEQLSVADAAIDFSKSRSRQKKCRSVSCSKHSIGRRHDGLERAKRRNKKSHRIEKRCFRFRREFFNRRKFILSHRRFRIGIIF